MRWSTPLLVILVGCSSSSSDNAKPHAALQVSFGSAAPATLSAEVMSNSTSSRFMAQASDGHITVFVSLATPVQPQTIVVSPDAQNVSIWAKQDAGTPLIATAGTLTVETAGGLIDLQLSGVSKPEDATGASVLIAGSMTGVNAPP